MLTFEQVNNWFNTHIKPMNKITEVSTAAVDEAISLYQSQDDFFNTEAKRKIAEIGGNEFIKVLAGMKPKSYQNNPVSRTDNGVGCVILSANPLADEYRVYVSLVVPTFYHILVTLQIDSEKNIVSGGIHFTSLYAGTPSTSRKIAVNSKGTLLDEILSFKDKTDNNQPIEEPRKNRVEGKLKFEFGKGLVKDNG